jgi:hypothetical protein
VTVDGSTGTLADAANSVSNDDFRLSHASINFPLDCRSRLFTPCLRFIGPIVEKLIAKLVLGAIQVNTT